MNMFESMVDALKAQKRKIVFTEGTDPRILEAASRLYKDGVLTPILLGNPDEIEAAAREFGWPVDGIEKIDPLNYEGSEEMTAKMVELRKGKMDEAACREALKKSNYFGTMLVKIGKADCLLGGATYSTADTVRPALQLIKARPGSKIVSSCFILYRQTESGKEMYAMADCAINVNPDEKK
jgi:phosphate acetyltransferase